MSVTRKDVHCPFFGAPKSLLPSVLPTNADVIKYWQQVRYDMTVESTAAKSGQKLRFAAVADTVACEIESLYSKASIPFVSHTRVVQKIKKLHDQYYALRKSYSRDKDTAEKPKKYNDFIEQCSNSLFDISSCKCEMTLHCSCEKSFDTCSCLNPILVDCTCPKERKVPPLEIKFLYAQRHLRLGKIGPIDAKESQKLTLRLQRKGRQPKQTSLPGPSSCNIDPETETTFENNNGKDDPDFQFPRFSSSQADCLKTKQMRLSLSATALTSDRFGVSDRATAAIASSVLKDVGLVTDSNTSLIVDRSKIRREKEKCRAKLITSDKVTGQINDLMCVYFDGRMDDTLVLIEKGCKRHQTVRKEEHISVIKEPGSKYLCHLVPTSKTGKDTAFCIVDHFEENGIDPSNIVVVGSDGTSTNTGWKNGAIKYVEMRLQRPVQWAICLLHFNELPLRHLVEALDGKTSGPQSFNGPLGKQLAHCESLPVVAFQKIECSLPEIVDYKNLSKDQRYLHDIAIAIDGGSCSQDLENRDPGPISHSRWLTTANRFLRLYISLQEPSENLIQIVKYILTVYVPMWFEIKTKSSIVDGPKHILECIKKCRNIPSKVQDVVHKVIQTNAFFAHPENILLSMVVDDREHVRELGLTRVLKTKEVPVKGKNVRNFLVPKINFESNEYYELINWSETKLTCPPLLASFSSDTIAQLIIHKEKPKLNINLADIPCHTQAVERCVKLVTEAASKVYGNERRDGFIRATLASRAFMPKFDTKAEFNIAK